MSEWTDEQHAVVEICAGAGGQALGLEKAGFSHALAVELDENASNTLRHNRPGWRVRTGDVASADVWDPSDFEGVSLLAGGVPCPPFSIAGRQLGASDERDLFAWAVEQVGIVKPRALMLENVRGLSQPRFAAYRQRILERLSELGYVAFWKLLHSADFGVPQLRPRFVLVALQPDDAHHFAWPTPGVVEAPTVGDTLHDLMAAGGWKHVIEWVALANDIAPTLVGGSKKHGGADLGPTRAKAKWLELGVDAKGVADAPPGRTAPRPSKVPPRLTVDMLRRIQGWKDGEWEFTGRKTSQYRQIGNAFPPPVAQVVGSAILDAFDRVEVTRRERHVVVGDPLFALLNRRDAMSATAILAELPHLTPDVLDKRMAALGLDFEVETDRTSGEAIYRLGEFRGFVGQDKHFRHDYVLENRSKVS